ncbi:glycosyltransferase [Collinsella sp. An2]|uniref:glycosyltransferase n=1 Tax=Collinsella sp. An2 TaxID=1965585 RepID=UPI00130233E6|nr:glycosyltransferase [Collinsella sp. An2]
MPSVSVILPIYNVENYLEQCLASVRDQTLADIEIICVDDGSTDSSPSIMDRFAAEDKRFHVIHKENGGYGKAVNTGLAFATGTYIGIVEPDDYVSTRMFETLLNAAKQHDEPDIVKSAYWRVVNANTDQEQLLPAFYYHAVEHTGVVFTLDQDAEFLFHHPSIWTAIYKRSFLEDKGIRMHEIPGAGWADNPWLIETLVQARSIVYVDECLYYYREFNTGSSSVVKDPSIIYNRWLDMDHIIKDLGITAPRILEGHFNRGCAYIEMLQKDFNTKDPNIAAALHTMVGNIDYNVVRHSRKIPRNYKAAYYKEKNYLLYLGYRMGRKLKSMLGR